MQRLPNNLPLQLLLCESELRSHAVARLRAGLHAILRGADEAAADEGPGPAPFTVLLAARVEGLRAGGGKGVPAGGHPDAMSTGLTCCVIGHHFRKKKQQHGTSDRSASSQSLGLRLLSSTCADAQHCGFDTCSIWTAAWLQMRRARSFYEPSMPAHGPRYVIGPLLLLLLLLIRPQNTPLQHMLWQHENTPIVCADNNVCVGASLHPLFTPPL